MDQDLHNAYAFWQSAHHVFWFKLLELPRRRLRYWPTLFSHFHTVNAWHLSMEEQKL